MKTCYHYFAAALLPIITGPTMAGTLAQWDFETDLVDSNVSPGTSFGHTTANAVFEAAAADISGNGNHLSVFSSSFGFMNHSDVVAPSNQTGTTRSVQNGDGLPGLFTSRDLKVGASNVGALTTWTVEASVRFTDTGANQTIVGKDGKTVGLDARSPLFILRKAGNGKFSVEFSNGSGATTRVDSTTSPVVGTWYHLAVTGDGTTTKIYVNGVLENSGSSVGAIGALNTAAGTDGVGDGVYAWTVGRGMWNGVHADRIKGYIDDVRISDAVLTPGEFLNILDSDNDGLPDAWELAQAGVTSLADLTDSGIGTPPGSGTGDFDNDGLSDVAEYNGGVHSTNAGLTDTDADGLGDAVETNNGDLSYVSPTDTGTDPLDPDSDGDGVFDGAEIANATDPTDVSDFPAYTPATLEHLYTFNADATDQVGTADGTLIADATVTGGQVVMDGTGDYVSLDAANIAINTYTSVTFEAWWTHNTQATWQRVFDFGRTNGANGAEYIFYSPVGNPNAKAAQYATISDTDPGFNSEESIAIPGRLPNGTYHMALVFDSEINNAMILYINGVRVGQVPVTKSLSSLSNQHAYLGEASYPGDNNLNGSIDEFRIYNGVRTPSQILANYNAGPVPLTDFKITGVNLNAAGTTLNLDVAGLISGATYHLESSETLLSGSFDPVPGSQWNAGGSNETRNVTVDTASTPKLFIRAAEGPIPTP